MPAIAMREWAFGTTVVVLSLVFIRPLLAQTPNSPNVSGRVATVDGAPLPGVEVRIDGTRAVTRTDEKGAYRFARVPAGAQTLRFHRIGYFPGALTVNVPSVSDSVTVVMVHSRWVLDTVKVNARVYDVGGIVVDENSRPVAEATIDVIGETATAAVTADSGGWFNFGSVKVGPTILRARKPSYAEATYSLDVEDSRGIVLHLQRLPADLSSSKAADYSGFGNNDEFVWTETRQRVARRDARSRIVSREQLAAFSGKSLGEAIRMLDEGNSVRSDLVTTNDQVCVLEDGRVPVGLTTLDAFAADRVDFVELYPPGTESSGSVQRYLSNGVCRAPGNRAGRSPFYAVIWLRRRALP